MSKDLTEDQRRYVDDVREEIAEWRAAIADYKRSEWRWTLGWFFGAGVGVGAALVGLLGWLA